MKKTFLFLVALAMSAMMWAVDGTYNLCTSIGDLVAGEHYIIANGVDGDVYCMATAANANNRRAVSATVSESAIEVSEGSGILTLTLGGESGAWTFHTDNYAGEDGYLASASSGSNNYCRVIADLTTATISFSESGAAVINLQPHKERTLLRFNPNTSNNNPLFACYKSGQQDIYLYKKAPTTLIPATLEGLVIKGEATKMEYEVGEAFDPAGLEVWGIYTKTVKNDSTSQIKSGLTWTADPEAFAEISDNESVTLSVAYEDKRSTDTVISGIKVKAVVPKMDITFNFIENLYGHTGVSSGSGNTYVNAGDIAVGEKFTEEPAQIEFTVDGKTQTRFWDASNKHELRLYNGATFVLSLVGNYKIIKVEFTGSAVNLNGNGVAVSDKVWEGDAAQSVTFVNSSAQSKINSIKVTYIAADPITDTHLQEVMMNANTRKIMRNGHIFILRNNTMFNIQGVMVK